MIKGFSMAVTAVIALLLIILGVQFYRAYMSDQANVASSGAVMDPANTTYIIGDDSFTLKNGIAVNDFSPSSDTKNTVRLFGEPVYGDLDNDGDADAAVELVNTPGGSGTFYYAALVINDGATSHATNAMLLGDRIAPQTVEIHDGRAVYNFAERAPTDPMTAQPSIGKSIWVNYDQNSDEIGEWVKDFEGESAAGMTESEARSIAEATCIKGGEALSKGTHNKGTQTWWFDANLNATQPGCHPACVVNEVTKTAEINWRCTGLKAQ